MGRNKYTPEQRAQIITTFLSAATKILRTEGVKGVSIRKVAAMAGYNSATLYLYFKDVNDLITLASIGYLEGYCRTLANSRGQMTDALSTYLYAWQVLSRYATAHPDVFYQLFFGEHDEPLSASVERYYSIHPGELANLDDGIIQFLTRGDLADRNRFLLDRLAATGTVDASKVENINLLTVAYFKSLLEELMSARGTEVPAEFVPDRMDQMNRFLLEL